MARPDQVREPGANAVPGDVGVPAVVSFLMAKVLCRRRKCCCRQLAAPGPISRQSHGHALADHEHGERILDQLRPEQIDFGVIGLSFPAAVPAVAVIGAVSIDFTVTEIIRCKLCSGR